MQPEVGSCSRQFPAPGFGTSDVLIRSPRVDRYSKLDLRHKGTRDLTFPSANATFGVRSSAPSSIALPSQLGPSPHSPLLRNLLKDVVTRPTLIDPSHVLPHPRLPRLGDPPLKVRHHPRLNQEAHPVRLLALMGQPHDSFRDPFGRVDGHTGSFESGDGDVKVLACGREDRRARDRGRYERHGDFVARSSIP